MKIAKIAALMMMVGLITVGCAGQNAQSGAAGGAVLGALLGYGIGEVVAPGLGGPAAAIGAAVGGAGGWVTGDRRDRQEIGSYRDQQQAAAAQAQMPRESCSWVYDSVGKAFWSCSGAQNRYRTDGPPAMPFPLPPNVPQAAYQQQFSPFPYTNPPQPSGRSPSYRSDSDWVPPMDPHPSNPPETIPVRYK